MGATVLKAALVFALTNADGLLLLTLLFGQTPRRRWRIVAGQGLGFAGIVLLGLFGRLVATLVSPAHLGWLGLAPIALGAYQWWTAGGAARPAGVVPGDSVARVAALVFASGADNIAVYLPWFAAASAGQTVVILGTFGVLVGVWCAVAAGLGRHQLVQASVRRLGPRFSGLVLIVLGLYVLISSGTLHR